MPRGAAKRDRIVKPILDDGTDRKSGDRSKYRANVGCFYRSGRHRVVADGGDAARANVQRKTVPYHTREQSYMAILHVLIIRALAFFASVSAW